MARKRVIDDTPALCSWEDVNEVLRDIGETERILELIENNMQQQIDSYKLSAEQAARPHQDRLELLERQIARYAEEHRADFGKSKTMELNFGTVGFRKSSKIKLPKVGPLYAEIIRRLKERGMQDCINRPPAKVDRDALKKYDPAVIREVGAQLIEEDIFGYEVDREKLKAAKA
jgi:phage host-nuclease inhibitor protein Gam